MFGMEQTTRVSRHHALLGCLVWIISTGISDSLCPNTPYEAASLCSTSTATGSRVYLDGSDVTDSDMECRCLLVTSAEELEVYVVDAPGGANCDSSIEFNSENIVTFECVRTGTVIKTDNKKEFYVVFRRNVQSALANYCLEVKARPLSNGSDAEVSLFCKSKRREILESQEISTETGVIPPDPSLTTAETTTDRSDASSSTVQGSTGETTPHTSNTATDTTRTELSSSTGLPKMEESRSAGLDTTTIIIIAVVAAVVVIAAVVIVVVVYVSRRSKHGKDVRGRNYVYYNDGTDVDEEKPKKIMERDETKSSSENKTMDRTKDNAVLVSENYDMIDEPNKTE